MAGGPPTALGRLLNVAMMVIEYSFAIEIAGRVKRIPMSNKRSRNPTKRTTLAMEAVAVVKR